MDGLAVKTACACKFCKYIGPSLIQSTRILLNVNIQTQRELFHQKGNQANCAQHSSYASSSSAPYANHKQNSAYQELNQQNETNRDLTKNSNHVAVDIVRGSYSNEAGPSVHPSSGDKHIVYQQQHNTNGRTVQADYGSSVQQKVQSSNSAHSTSRHAQNVSGAPTASTKKHAHIYDASATQHDDHQYISRAATQQAQLYEQLEYGALHSDELPASRTVPRRVPDLDVAIEHVRKIRDATSDAVSRQEVFTQQVANALAYQARANDQHETDTAHVGHHDPDHIHGHLENEAVRAGFSNGGQDQTSVSGQSEQLQPPRVGWRENEFGGSSSRAPFTGSTGSRQIQTEHGQSGQSRSQRPRRVVRPQSVNVRDSVYYNPLTSAQCSHSEILGAISQCQSVSDMHTLVMPNALRLSGKHASWGLGRLPKLVKGVTQVTQEEQPSSLPEISVRSALDGGDRAAQYINNQKPRDGHGAGARGSVLKAESLSGQGGSGASQVRGVQQKSECEKRAELVDVLSNVFIDNIGVLTMHDISNGVWGMGRLGYTCTLYDMITVTDTITSRALKEFRLTGKIVCTTLHGLQAQYHRQPALLSHKPVYDSLTRLLPVLFTRLHAHMTHEPLQQEHAHTQPSLPPHNTAILLWACARINRATQAAHVPPVIDKAFTSFNDVLAAFNGYNQQYIASFTPQNVSNALWALGVLGMRPQSLIVLLTRQYVSNLRAFQQQELVAGLWGITENGLVLAPGVLDDVCEQCMPRISRQNCATGVMLATALARCGHAQPAVWQELASWAINHAHELHGQYIVNMCWALSKVDAEQCKTALPVLAHVLRDTSHLSAVPPHLLPVLAWSLSRQNVVDTHLFNMITTNLAPQLTVLRSHSLAMLARGLGFARHKHVQTERAVGGLFVDNTEVLSTMSSTDIAGICTAFHQLCHVDTPLFAGFVDVLVTQARALSGEVAPPEPAAAESRTSRRSHQSNTSGIHIMRKLGVGSGVTGSGGQGVDGGTQSAERYPVKLLSGQQLLGSGYLGGQLANQEASDVDKATWARDAVYVCHSIVTQALISKHVVGADEASGGATGEDADIRAMYTKHAEELQVLAVHASFKLGPLIKAQRRYLRGSELVAITQAELGLRHITSPRDVPNHAAHEDGSGGDLRQWMDWDGGRVYAPKMDESSRGHASVQSAVQSLGGRVGEMCVGVLCDDDKVARGVELAENDVYQESKMQRVVTSACRDLGLIFNTEVMVPGTTNRTDLLCDAEAHGVYHVAGSTSAIDHEQRCTPAESGGQLAQQSTSSASDLVARGQSRVGGEPRGFVIEVDGGFHYMTNMPRVMTGTTRTRNAMIEMAGYDVIQIPYYDISGVSDEQIRNYVKNALLSKGWRWSGCVRPDRAIPNPSARGKEGMRVQVEQQMQSAPLI